MDFKDLVSKYKDRKCYYLLDPPYLCDDKQTYKAGLSFLDNMYIFELLKTSYKFILFTSDTSMFKEMMESGFCFRNYKEQIIANYNLFNIAKRKDILYYA